MPQYAIWRSRPVFVTSTFRDMHAERDYLHSHVFPELVERLRERLHHLEPIDLRWGVETRSVDEQRSKELLVLKVCLAEIERSRPFLIALIGDRYGWVPPQDRTKAAAEEAGYQGELAGKSITALEIEFGVLDSADHRRRTWFYFRDPLPYSEMDSETAAEYSDERSPEAGAREAHARLQALKARIAREMPDRVRHYRATWDKEPGRVAGLEAWGRQVLEDLWRDLKEEIPEPPVRAVTWQAQERSGLEQFVETQCRDFVGREETIADLLRLASSSAAEGEQWGVCVVGASGSGKSSLFAQLCRLLAREDALVLAHAAGISVRSSQVDSLLRRWTQELAEFLGVADPAEGITAREELEREFARLLGQAAMRRRVVCLLDALNQFERTPTARYLTWLPVLWPPNARLIATAIPGEESATLGRRPGAEVKELPLLNEQEAEEIAVTVCKRYHKSIDPEVLAALTSKQRDGKPAAGLPLWLELALEELLLLDADDFGRVDREFTGEPEQRLHQLLLHVVEELPPDIESLYGYLLARTEEVYGERWARAFANLITVTRAGLRESDLQELLPQLSGEAWQPVRFAALRRGFRAHLVQRGALGQWDFFHAQTRTAVDRRNLADLGERKRLHTAIADHLETLPREDLLRQTELMFHYIGADDKTRAAQHLGDPLLSESEQTVAISDLLLGVLEGETQAGNPQLEWTCSLLAADAIQDQCRGLLCHRIMFDLFHLMEVYASAAARGRLATAVRDALSSLLPANPTCNELLRDLASAYKAVADNLSAEGQYELALQTYKEALRIAKRLVGVDRNNTILLHDLTVIHCFIGNLLLNHGEYDSALRHYQDGNAISEQLAEAQPENADWQRSLAIGYEKVGDVREAQGRYDEAIEAYRKDLAVTERLVAQAPEDYQFSLDLSIVHERIGQVQLAEGRPADALRSFRQMIEIRNRLLTQYATATELQYDISVGMRLCGDAFLALSQVDQAEQFYRRASATAEWLVSRDSSSSEWQREMGACHERLGDTVLLRGNAGGALASYRAAVDIADRLVERDRNNAGWSRDLAVSSYKAATACARIEDWIGARRSLDLCRKTLRRMKRAGMYLDRPLVQLLEQLEKL